MNALIRLSAGARAMCTAAARPARAPNAFIKFSSEHRAAVKATMPKDAKATDVAKELGARWRALSDAERAAYKDKAVAPQATTA